MARTPQQPEAELSAAEIAVADSADVFAVRFLRKSGEYKTLRFRTFAEAHANAAMSPDPKAAIQAVAPGGAKADIPRADWPRWIEHFR